MTATRRHERTRFAPAEVLDALQVNIPAVNADKTMQDNVNSLLAKFEWTV